MRELENILEGAVALHDEGSIEVSDLKINRQRPAVFSNIESGKSLSGQLGELEKITIKAALDKTRGNKRKASKLLNISERTLYRKIKQYDLIPPEE